MKTILLSLLPLLLCNPVHLKAQNYIIAGDSTNSFQINKFLKISNLFPDSSYRLDPNFDDSAEFQINCGHTTGLHWNFVINIWAYGENVVFSDSYMVLCGTYPPYDTNERHFNKPYFEGDTLFFTHQHSNEGNFYCACYCYSPIYQWDTDGIRYCGLAMPTATDTTLAWLKVNVQHDTGITILSYGQNKPLFSVNEYFHNSGIVYPNPATDVIEAKGFDNEMVYFYNRFGQLCKTYYCSQHVQRIPVSDLENGLYFLKSSYKPLASKFVIMRR